MSLKDRGIKKWQGFFMPEHVTELGVMHAELDHVAKPIIDEHQQAEFDARIAYAMEFNLALKISIWQAGNITEIVGRSHYVDHVRQKIRLVTLDGASAYVEMAEVVGVELA
ncbi:YolD-like family protein [Cytobacillus sp. FSL K6-0129]|uniref:YolD-like family protein n=1 Tax=Cytobacillus sp. FSL K6-0129 TaxID=2921421 RepID=UPI0030F9D21A